MAQRGRKGSKNIPPSPHANELAAPLTAPAMLSSEERQVFEMIVASVHPKHFARHQQMLLASYARVTVKLKHLSAHAPLDEFSGLTRLQFACATRLRLTPQSLLEPRTAARRAAEHSPSLVAQFLAENPDEDRRRTNGVDSN
jgi:hypothetical protein